MDFGLFHTWNVLYEGGKVPWDPEYRGGKLLEEDAYAKNWEEMQAVEAMGWDYIWLGGGHFSKPTTVLSDPRCRPGGWAARLPPPVAARVRGLRLAAW